MRGSLSHISTGINPTNEKNGPHRKEKKPTMTFWHSPDGSSFNPSFNNPCRVAHFYHRCAEAQREEKHDKHSVKDSVTSIDLTITKLVQINPGYSNPPRSSTPRASKARKAQRWKSPAKETHSLTPSPSRIQIRDSPE